MGLPETMGNAQRREYGGLSLRHIKDLAGARQTVAAARQTAIATAKQPLDRRSHQPRDWRQSASVRVTDATAGPEFGIVLGSLVFL